MNNGNRKIIDIRQSSSKRNPSTNSETFSPPPPFTVYNSTNHARSSVFPMLRHLVQQSAHWATTGRRAPLLDAILAAYDGEMALLSVSVSREFCKFRFNEFRARKFRLYSPRFHLDARLSLGTLLISRLAETWRNARHTHTHSHPHARTLCVA